ncbi:MAG: hypothetical protein A2942_01645 [Candidatus Lloydbacteria bacterium RIFCSPLOWO2_01_FULL_50_20]|uniref:Uncharacterized protein n=1 Tax=Candidatus Lloydbacteria bacterium RIFCSPLOWO2_01_FULL_50_20 TaxID=1798665 RepID=A0A1G2DGV4_9BACT|nr:MAG: hypothetical protein A2942_01645 [Candidatus Lloydbacteria bacterium RIFCSPLOWO2_01_FULL_50_20]
MPLLRIESDGQWIGRIGFSELLDVPVDMDVRQEERVWFTNGGGRPKDFVAHLIAKGAKKVWVPVHVINYV